MIIGRRNNILQRIPIKLGCQGYYLRWWYNGWHYWFFLPGDHAINTEGERYFTLSTRTITMSSGQVTREQAAAIRTIFFTKEVYMLGVAGWMETRIDPGTPEIYNNMVAGTEIIITAHIGSREVSYVNGYTPVPDIPIVPPSEPVMCELIIGTQIWACYNVDTDYPGSKVYGGDETKRSSYGGLYNWTQIMASGFCPEGWHIPTLAEWQTLIDFLGGDAVAGGHLKSINAIHWNSPNTDADDSVDFSGRGAGVGTINSFTGALEFMHLLNYEYLWTADEDDPPWSELSAKCVRLAYDSGAVVKTSGNKLSNYLSVRLIKDEAAAPCISNPWGSNPVDGSTTAFDPIAPVPHDLLINASKGWTIAVTHADIIPSKFSGTCTETITFTVLPGAVAIPLGDLVISCAGEADITLHVERSF